MRSGRGRSSKNSMCAATTRKVERLTDRAAPRTVAGRILAVLLSVALLGAAPVVREFDLGILKRRVEGNLSTIRVKRGDTVFLRWRSDEAVLLHLHGYDLRASVTPAVPAYMRFEAGAAGRFAISAHEFGPPANAARRSKKHREITLLYLEVLPE